MFVVVVSVYFVVVCVCSWQWGMGSSNVVVGDVGLFPSSYSCPVSSFCRNAMYVQVFHSNNKNCYVMLYCWVVVVGIVCDLWLEGLAYQIMIVVVVC